MQGILTWNKIKKIPTQASVYILITRYNSNLPK